MDGPVAADVQDRRALLGHDAADEQVAVARGRVFLAAQNRHAVLPHAALEALDPGAEQGRAGDLRVADPALGVVKFLAFRPTAQLGAEEQVLDAHFGDKRRQAFSVEVRCVLAIRLRPRISQDFDAVLVQQPHEDVGGMVGMPDGEQYGRRVRFAFGHRHPAMDGLTEGQGDL